MSLRSGCNSFGRILRGARDGCALEWQWKLPHSAVSVRVACASLPENTKMKSRPLDRARELRKPLRMHADQKNDTEKRKTTILQYNCRTCRHHLLDVTGSFCPFP